MRRFLFPVSAVGLLAALLLAGTIAGAGPSPSAGQPHAVAAKKKCKKSKKAAAAKKKKHCKKKSATPTTPAPTSRVRASLTWDNPAINLDLHVLLSGTEQASPSTPGGIPSASHGGDVTGGSGAPEVFTDQLPPFSRKFSFYVCKNPGPTLTASTNMTLTWVDSTGVSHIGTALMSDQADNEPGFVEPGAFDPGMEGCP